jgi:hypothetical protein
MDVGSPPQCPPEETADPPPPAKLYSTLYQHVLERENVRELTVEDPAEAFEDLRDRNDLKWLVKQGIMEEPQFLKDIGTGVRGERGKWENETRAKYKIAPVSSSQHEALFHHANPLSVSSTGCSRCCCSSS